MPEPKRMYMTRRGIRYLIERSADGTFGRWIPVGNLKKGGRGMATKKAATKTPSRVLKSNKVEAKPTKKLATKKTATKKSAKAISK
jgi:hypothetical protein